MAGVLVEAELLAAFPPEVLVDPAEVAASVAGALRVLVVLDDDPTGTQSVADLPVLLRWEVEDFRWAFTHRVGAGAAPAVYVLTNTRSLDAAEASARTREVVTNALAAAAETGRAVGFVSRSDSTLRGHYPLEPDVIAATLAEVTGQKTDGVVIVPAFPDAGRITIGGVHYMRSDGALIPVADTEYAKDATFGYRSSELARYVEEKSAGRFVASDVIVLDLSVVRGGPVGIAAAVASAKDSTPIVVDVVTENDLRALALGLALAESQGTRLLYRVGPPFVRARIGQSEHPALTRAQACAGAGPGGGLIVVGSHVGTTTRQLALLTRRHASAAVVELEVELLLDEATAGPHVAVTASAVAAALARTDVILHTSRLLVRSEDPAESLRIARAVSAGVVDVVRRAVALRRPRFVIAKGGITSSDVAALGLAMRRAVVRGPMLPGIISLWEPMDGPAAGAPYVVFAGNVGDDDALDTVVRTLSTTR